MSNASTSLSVVGTADLGLVVGLGAILMSPWKPVVILLFFGMWAWFVSRVLDKHAARFHLNRQAWNTFHLSVGFLALCVAFLFPLPGQLSYVISVIIMIVLLVVSVMSYVIVANKDERVPEKHRLTLDMSSWREAREQKGKEKLAGKVELVIKKPDGSLLQAPEVDSEAYTIRIAAESAMLKALASRASEYEYIPTGANQQYGVALLVDGVSQAGDQMPGAEAMKILDFWKAAAGMDVTDRRRLQTTDLKIDNGPLHLVVRISSVGTSQGPKLSLLFNPSKAVRRKPQELGMLDPQFDVLRELVEEGTGVVLLSAPPDNGRTTLMYTIARMHDAYTQNVQTVELWAQDILEGVRQNIFDPAAEGPDYATLVRSLLRRDPDVVALAELPDTNTAKEIVRADLDRTRVYPVLRATSLLGAIEGWVKIVGDSAQAGNALRGVIEQRLARQLCPNCRVPYQPAPELLKKLGLPADKARQLYKKGGQVLIKNKPEVCPQCSGNGYFEQFAFFEVCRIGPEERALIGQKDWNGLKASIRKQQLPTLMQGAIARALDGTTSVEEVMRVLGESKPASRSPAQSGEAAEVKA